MYAKTAAEAQEICKCSKANELEEDVWKLTCGKEGGRAFDVVKGLRNALTG